MMCFKFNQNCTLNGEFYFLGLRRQGKGLVAPISNICKKKLHTKRWSQPRSFNLEGDAPPYKKSKAAACQQ